MAVDAVRVAASVSSGVDIPHEILQMTTNSDRSAFARESKVLILISNILSAITGADWDTSSKAAYPIIKCGVHVMLEYEPCVMNVIKHILSTMISDFECLDPKSYTFALTNSGDDDDESKPSNLHELMSISPASIDCVTLNHCLCVLELVSSHSKEIPPKPEVVADSVCDVSTAEQTNKILGFNEVYNYVYTHQAANSLC